MKPAPGLVFIRLFNSRFACYTYLNVNWCNLCLVSQNRVEWLGPSCMRIKLGTSPKQALIHVLHVVMSQ